MIDKLLDAPVHFNAPVGPYEHTGAYHQSPKGTTMNIRNIKLADAAQAVASAHGLTLTPRQQDNIRLVVGTGTGWSYTPRELEITVSEVVWPRGWDVTGDEDAATLHFDGLAGVEFVVDHDDVADDDPDYLAGCAALGLTAAQARLL